MDTATRIKRKIKNTIGNVRWGGFGRRSRVISPMRIFGKKYIFIGDNVSVLNDARIEVIDQWGAQKCSGRLTIGSNTTIEQRCHIVAADDLRIGKDCLISADVYISDCSHGLRPDKPILEQPLEIKHTEVKDGVFIGIGAKIMPGVSLGEHSVVGAGAVVTHDVADFAIVAGVPARKIGSVLETEDPFQGPSK